MTGMVQGSARWRSTAALAFLRAAGLVDQRDRWIGGRAILIQTGDIVDRGDTPGPSIGRITTRFGGRVILVDTGMLEGDSYPGGTPSALALHGEKMTAIYTTRREPLSTPTRGGSGRSSDSG